MKIVFYDKDEFDEYINSLPLKVRRKVLLVINHVQSTPLILMMRRKVIKKLSKVLYEIRIRFSNRSERAIFFIDDDTYVITNAFTKKTNKTPHKQIKLANKRRRRYLQRRNFHE